MFDEFEYDMWRHGRASTVVYNEVCWEDLKLSLAQSPCSWTCSTWLELGQDSSKFWFRLCNCWVQDYHVRQVQLESFMFFHMYIYNILYILFIYIYIHTHHMYHILYIVDVYFTCSLLISRYFEVLTQLGPVPPSNFPCVIARSTTWRFQQMTASYSSLHPKIF
jgi:hypothetical protein